MSAKFKSLFLCIGNSCGSQMAEEWAQHLKCKVIESSCPVFPGKTQVTHVNFDKPPSLAKSAKSEEEALSYFRRVRDEIRIFTETLPSK